MTPPRALLLDLDDTLAKSLEAPSREMIEHLKRLLEVFPVAIMTGRDFPRVEPGFLPSLTASPHIGRFFLFTEAGAECFQWQEGEWKTLYSNAMSPEEFRRIRGAIEECVAATGAYEGLPRFGERFVEKRAMFTFMALGVEVQGDLKYTWDPGNKRRTKLWEALSAKLPEFDVTMGGATAIDVVRKGSNKSYGVRWLSERLGIPPQEMLYVGDALYPGGNDYVVIPTGIQTRSTTGPEETLRIIGGLL